VAAEGVVLTFLVILGIYLVFEFAVAIIDIASNNKSNLRQ